MMGPMPRINAASVKEHRAAMTQKLVDAAEELLRDGDVSALTAGAVTASAGIARNSLYRYVDSVDGLRAAVVARHLPQWVAQVEDAVAAADTPEAKLYAYLESNISAAAVSGHGWLMKLARGLSREALAQVAGAHESLAGMLISQCRAIDPSGITLTAAYVQAILEASFDRVDAGDDPTMVQARCVEAVAAIVAARKTARDQSGTP